MENNITQMSDLMAVNKDNGEVLGKFVYFSLSNVLVEKLALESICDAVGLPYSGGARTSDINAFRSATGDIYKRVVSGGEIFKVYCRDNERSKDMVSRELVKETLGATTNRYTKLANLYFSVGSGYLSYDNLSYDPIVDPLEFCEQAEYLFEKYKHCAGRKHIETLTDAFLDRMQAIKISIYGRLFFVPRNYMQEVTLFEDFIEALNTHNQNTTTLVVNSMYVMDDEKQRQKMAAEFYTAVRKEIELYQERAEHLILTNSQSPAVMSRWILKIDSLQKKKQEYENILHRELDELNCEFDTLRIFSQELQIRSRRLEQARAA